MAAITRLARPVVWTILAICALLPVAIIAWQRLGPASQRLAWTDRTSTRLDAAEAAYKQGDWTRAVDLSRSLLKANSDDAAVLRIYARASARLERDAAAAAIFHDRLGDARLQTEDLFLIGLGLVRAGKLDDALEIWAKAARAEPACPELLDHLARLSTRSQQLDLAAQSALQLSRQPGWEARGYFVLGEVQGLLGNPRGAVDSIRQALKLDSIAKNALFPADHYHKLLARNLLRLGQGREALETLQASARRATSGTTDTEAEWLTSRAYLQESQPALALAALARSGSFREDNPLSPEPSPYVGAARCASCHAKEARSHERSRHSRTFHHDAGLLPLPVPDQPLPDPADPKVTHTFERLSGQIQVKTRTGESVFNLVVEYAFGLPENYVTMIGRDDSRVFRAARLSSYHTQGGLAWGRSSGDVPVSDSREDVRGEPIGMRDGFVRCLYCHVTNFRNFRDPPPEEGIGPEAADAAIGCERCHGPGGNHLAAIKAGFRDRAIVNAGLASASAVVAQCADCHVVGLPEAIKAAPADPMFVRSTGLTLTFSRCYTESGGGMSCLTCHDPHRDDEGPPAFFEAKCLSCHSAQVASQKVCRVNPSRDCLSCHMPKVPVEALHTSLTDHYIRVRKEK